SAAAVWQAWRRWAGVLVSVLVLSVALVWVYRQAEAVVPVQHERYVLTLSRLQALDARADSEVLAARMGLVNNYDGLTQLFADIGQQVDVLLVLPDYLPETARQQHLSLTRGVQSALASKADLADVFKRHNAVLRNSLAYFPHAMHSFLQGTGTAAASVADRQLAEQYGRVVMVYALSPSEANRQNVAAVAADVAKRVPTRQVATGLGHLALHGQEIVRRIAALEAVHTQWGELGSGRLLGQLSAGYARAHAAAEARAAVYRLGLYGLALVLAVYLVGMFVVLERARQSLARAHAETADRLAAQLAAERQLKLHSTSFQHSHDGITLTDAQGNILDVNPAFSRITGWSRGEVLGRNPRVLRSGRHDKAFYEAMWNSIQYNGTWTGEIWNRNKFGEVFPELLSISAVRDEAGTVTNYVAVFSDIRRLKAQENQLTKLAYFDPLTELPNRTLLSDKLGLALVQARRMHTLLAVCYLDLDGFKPINDTWGHEAGDRVLVDVAHRLKSAVDAGDTVARIGGDEFVILMTGMGALEACLQACQRVLDVLQQPMVVGADAVQLSASMGVALYPQDDADADTLLRHADQAMYVAKQTGKNCYHLFDAELDRDARSHLDRMGRVREALMADEMRLFYQPKVNLRTGQVAGMEALVRWLHPQTGLVPPADFLPLIEDDDLIIELGDWVIEAALNQMQLWRAQGLCLPVSVNVAGRQLQAPDFVQKLTAAIGRHPQVPAADLQLEILETTGLEDIVKVSRVIAECHQLGVTVALDDFGTGYSSLTYLKRLPVDTVKIDQSFVRDMLNDPDNLAIVQSVTRLAGSFDRELVAEGVESVEHGRMLTMLGCHVFQGYGVARPMPADQVNTWVANWQMPSEWQKAAGHIWTDGVYPVLLAEIQHRSWVNQLVHAVSQGWVPPHTHMADAHACLFGQWYDTAAASGQDWAQSAAFTAIREP
ncbi:MAG: EAL domain-containing protein, partial [Burkholderiales bacterium]|nr:EAL domain-containing protein [Burkholderiales bacterium]